MSCARWVGAVWAALLLAACFEDDPSGVGGTGGTGGTTGGGCSNGSVGCPCYGNGSCDEGLRCATEADLCIYDDPSCTPGTLGCACDGDACNDGSVCMSGYCGMGGGGTDTGATSMATTVGTTMPGESSTMIDPSTTGVDSGEDTFAMTSGSVSDTVTSSTTNASMTDASASASDTGDLMMCYDCIENVKQADCAMPWSDCMSNADCSDMVADYTGCLLGAMDCGLQLCDSYCGMAEPQYCVLYNEFAYCVAQACPACGDFACA